MEHQITKHGSRVFLAILIILTGWGLNSCYYDNVEELYPNPPTCDTTNVTYSGTVAPIMAASCNSCHSTTSASGGIITDNYDDLKSLVDGDRFWGAINQQSGYSPMPQGAEKLNDCKLAKIDTWIYAGAPNN